jgi:tetratricopeptide (TPR) repeat protein
LTLINLQRLPEAVVELRQAIQLRPHHYYQWLDLGVTLDRLGDQAGAAAALQKSVELAPSFAQPRWQRGNLLFRQGTYEEAFQDLRLAVKSNPSLSEGMLELAWVAADNDVNRFEALVKPETSLKRFELAAFLARQEQSAEVVNQIRIAGPTSGRSRPEPLATGNHQTARRSKICRCLRGLVVNPSHISWGGLERTRHTEW